MQKMRTQSLQVASEKKAALEQNETLVKEKDDLRQKALGLLQRCKDLEQKSSRCEILEKEVEERNHRITILEQQLQGSNTSGAPPMTLSSTTQELQLKVAVLEESLSSTSNDLAKYKSAMDKALPKIKELRAALDAKIADEAKISAECNDWKTKYLSVASPNASSEVIPL